VEKVNFNLQRGVKKRSSCGVAAHLRAQQACCCLLAAVAPFLPISAARKMALLVLRSVPCSVVHMQSHSH
jgi:hypothetical protein